MGSQKAFKAQDVTGFMEIKQTNKALSLLSSLFSQKNQWPRRYCVIQGFKFFIYEGDKFNKPIKVIELSRDFRVKEVRRAEANGKQHVLSLVPGKNQVEEWVSTSTESEYNKWLKAFKAIQE
mmetsp:Transcript_29802/g.45453  ORF Transcript_29802/g.45453 Transcript_29802/m.45453 type:complete len:122 (+) Transcript_29802:4178-4543(+)